MAHPLPPLAPQPPIRGRQPSTPIRVMTRSLPQISLPWLELGLALALFVMLRLS